LTDVGVDLARFRPIARGLDHPECAAWGPHDGRVYAGGEAGQIYAIAQDGQIAEIATTGGFLYGLALDAAGSIFGCDFGRAELVRIDPSGTVRTWSKGTTERPMQVPNFCAFDDASVLYVTDSGTWGEGSGVIYRVMPDGRTDIWTDQLPWFPNGCCVTRDGDALLVAESGARRIARVPFQDDGSAGSPSTVAELSGSQPDGVTLADDGTLLVGCYRPDRIWRVEPGGAVSVFADDPDGVVLNQPANVAFFGEELDRVVVSALGGWDLETLDPGVRGLPLRYPTGL
jgi:gluconolactonase